MMADQTNNTTNTRSGRLNETVPLQPGDSLHIKSSGPITIRGADGPDVLIKGIGDMRWSRMEQQVSVRIDGPIKALVPRNITLRLSLDGPITVEGITAGDIDVISADGPLTIDGGASLRIHDADGPLNIANISGAVRVNEADGPINLKDIGGDITIEQADGPVTIKRCPGNVDVTNDGSVFLQLDDSVASTVRLRTDGSAYLKMPAATAVSGVIAGDDRILVELDQQRIETEDDTVTLSPPEGMLPTISVDIKVDGDVYIGPNPPAVSANTGFHVSGLGWLGSLFGRKRGTRRDKSVTTPPPSRQAGADDTLAEREMILRMVAEGKITAQEAAQLLEALE